MKKKKAIWTVKYKKNNENKWSSLEGPKGFWYADPILFEFNGQLYLFTEAFNMRNQKGYLAVSEYKDNVFTKPSIIIKKSCHLSYPCVFEYDGKLYMVPETGQNGTLELWECTSNIYTWHKKSILLKNVMYADTTVYIENHEIYLFAYEEGKPTHTHLFKLDMKKLKIEEIESIEHEKNNKRPAGKFFSSNGKLYRPLQNNVQHYGDSILINEIKSISPFKEETVKEITCDNFNFEDGSIRTHTLSMHNDLVVVDSLVMVDLPLVHRIYLFRKARNFMFKIKRKIQKMF